MHLIEIVTQRIAGTHSVAEFRNLVVEIGGATGAESIVLRGRTNSFHVKQLAQQGAREALPNARLENAIVVD